VRIIWYLPTVCSEDFLYVEKTSSKTYKFFSTIRRHVPDYAHGRNVCLVGESTDSQMDRRTAPIEVHVPCSTALILGVPPAVLYQSFKTADDRCRQPLCGRGLSEPSRQSVHSLDRSAAVGHTGWLGASIRVVLGPLGPR
jgi:hypothetical protein